MTVPDADLRYAPHGCKARETTVVTGITRRRVILLRNIVLLNSTILLLGGWIYTTSTLTHSERANVFHGRLSVKDRLSSVTLRDARHNPTSSAEKVGRSSCAGKSELRAVGLPSPMETIVAKSSRDVNGWLWAQESQSARNSRMKSPQAHQSAVHPSLEIDFVYKWVDGSRLAHLRRKRHWEKALSSKTTVGPNGMECPAIDIQQNSVRRERDNYELLFALRSLQMYAAWFRHIFIVVEGPHMIPHWLLLDYPHLSVIFHSDIFPEPQHAFLPTFNGHAVATVLHRIPCLSENFIAMDDDYFFTAPVFPENFFQIINGSVIGPTAVQEGGEVAPRREKGCHSAHHHDAANMNSASMMSMIKPRDVALHKFRRMRHEPYVASISARQHILENLFSNQTAALRAHRFRTKSDFHVESLAFNIAKNSEVLNLSGLVQPGQTSTLKCAFSAFSGENASKVFARLTRRADSNQFLGINDDMGDVTLDKGAMLRFYTDLWPRAAPWENATAVKLMLPLSPLSSNVNSDD